MRVTRIAACLALVLALTSCTRSFPVTAGFRDGKIIFLSEDNEVTFSPWCWNDFKVFDDTGRVVWGFDGYEAFKDAKVCGPNFPLFYGKEPKGAEVTHGAEPLKLGHVYVLYGNAGGVSDGAFMIYSAGHQLIIRNEPLDSPHVRAIFDARHQLERAVTE